ncbi:MAG: (2Fe-2S)-binding protein [Thaumarchaeota archaeon]|jgi:carbon-monoxide dehydrogenase small subunit|nr:(2Fe-2S)-binding protein [Nitrososphaerota archaeon]
MKQRIKLFVNGDVYEVYTEPNRTLLDVLREDLELTGTKRGCDSGECGACTVLLNGKPVNSCLVLAPEVDGQEVVTIEGISKPGSPLHPVQEAFIEKWAIQCGFCTPGMIISAKALLDRNPDPSEEEIKQALAGNLCRCTGYVKIIEAVKAAAEKMRRSGS